MPSEFLHFLLENQNLTLEYHAYLNPLFWTASDDVLCPVVRQRLLDIGKVWVDWAGIPHDAVKDYLLVGGMASYAYTDYSDLDLHVLVDTSKIADCPKILDDWLKDKKQLWTLTHDIKIHGHDVEVYAQDMNQKATKDQGVYSLTKNEWVVKPVHREDVDLDDPHIAKKVNDLKHRIESLMSSGADIEALDRLKDKIKNMRLSGLKHSGELSIENLVFKELRNEGILDRMTEYMNQKQDQELSL